MAVENIERLSDYALGVFDVDDLISEAVDIVWTILDQAKLKTADLIEVGYIFS